MARIFLSHSSANNAEAVALRDWLVEEGWDDLFLDLDPERGIAAGERWERALSDAANRCEAILFLVSRAWLGSRWCLRELHLALKLNKRLFGILIEDIALGELPNDLAQAWQLVDLSAGANHRMFRAVLPDGTESHVTFSEPGLLKLKTGLTKAGLDARYFAWPPEGDPERPPYRGLLPLEAADAGIFFGREAPIIEALDRLRGLSEAAPPRLFAILAASGAGKSSFLRAGLLPRLHRDDRHFLPLPLVRPERAVLSGEDGLLRSLEAAARSAGLRHTRAQIRAAIDAGADAVRKLLDEIATEASAPAFGEGPSEARPRLILPIDQAEELFHAEGGEEAGAFLRLACDLIADPESNLIVLLTIRSDSFEQLQTAPALDGITAQTFSLPPLPRGAYQTVIEGPARRLNNTSRALKIEPSLTAALLADIEAGGGKDALPLLAFTLERLYLDHGGDGDLRRSEYQAIGGIQGSIEAAVEHALQDADDDPAVPKDRAARLVVLRHALIPWLAGIDPETGAPRRRVARLAEIPEQARPLVEHLIAARLLATDISPETGEQTIEPAHEALLRQWGLLQGWLQEDFAALSILEGVKRAAREWSANGRHADWLAHTAGRLEDAEAQRGRGDLAHYLDGSERDYLAACRAAENARRDKERLEARQKILRQRRLVMASSVAAVVFAGVAVFAGFQRQLAVSATNTAKHEAQEATRNLSFALDATDRLALDIAQSLETNFDVPTRDKIFVAERLDANFAELIERVGAKDELTVRYADLLASNAMMFLDVGRQDLAQSRAERAHELLFPTDAATKPPKATKLLQARVKLVAALSLYSAMSYTRAEVALGEAEKLFDAAKGEGGAHEEAVVLGAQLLATRANLLRSHMQLSDAAAAEAEARKAINAALTQVAGGVGRARTRKALYSLLFRMDTLRIDIADILGSEDIQLLSAQMLRDLEQARPAYNAGEDPAWRFTMAQTEAVRSLALSQAQRTAASIDSATAAIEQLYSLVSHDYGNLVWRSELAEMLVRRAELARVRQDYRQAEVDLEAAMTLSVSLKRDSVSPGLVSGVDTLMDFNAGRLLGSKQKWDAALQRFAVMVARTRHRGNLVDADNVTTDRLVFAHYGAIEAHMGKKDYKLALKNVHEALDIISDYKSRSMGSSRVLTNRQYYISSKILESLDTDAVAQEWPALLADALSAADDMVEAFPNSALWQYNRAYVLGREGNRQSANKAYGEAAVLYRKAVEAIAVAIAREPENFGSVTSLIYYSRERVRNLALLGDWEELLGAVETAARYVPEKELGAADLEEMVDWWNSFVQQLESAVSAARAAGKGSSAASAGMEEQLRLAIDIRRRLEDQKAAGEARNGPKLPKDKLDLSAVKVKSDGDVLEVSTRLGFAARPVYTQGVWRTLTDSELARAIGRFSQIDALKGPAAKTKIERIRAMQLPFYDDGELLEAEYTDRTGAVVTVSLLVVQGSLYLLDGTSPPMHRANAAAPLHLRDVSDATAYLRFFTSYLSAEFGTFQIVETSQDLSWSSGAPEELKRAVGRIIRPVMVWADPEKPGWWRASVSIQYERAVFHALMRVQPSGMVEMMEDVPVASDLPIEAPLLTPAGRSDRVVQTIDLAAFGETPVTDEAAALEALASLPEGERPASYKQLAAEAAAIRAAMAKTPVSTGKP